MYTTNYYTECMKLTYHHDNGSHDIICMAALCWATGNYHCLVRPMVCNNAKRTTSYIYILKESIFSDVAIEKALSAVAISNQHNCTDIMSKLSASIQSQITNPAYCTHKNYRQLHSYYVTHQS